MIQSAKVASHAADYFAIARAAVDAGSVMQPSHLPELPLRALQVLSHEQIGVAEQLTELAGTRSAIGGLRTLPLDELSARTGLFRTEAFLLKHKPVEAQRAAIAPIFEHALAATNVRTAAPRFVSDATAVGLRDTARSIHAVQDRTAALVDEVSSNSEMRSLGDDTFNALTEQYLKAADLRRSLIAVRERHV